ncbi:MAG: dimethylsulfonioproprionate lyase family protein [Rhodospirillales bacterium]
MRDIIEAIENLLVSTSMHGGEAKDSADILLESIPWRKKPIAVEPRTFPVVEQRLEEACSSHGALGGNAQTLTNAVMAARDELAWVTPWGEYLEHADMAALVQNFAFTTIIGPGHPLEADGVLIGLSLQGPDLHYPMHAHQAGETYWIVGGDADWKIGMEPWFSVIPGSICVHQPGMRHAMQTNARPLLTVWAWWSHIDSNIVMIRG